jgi:hypothetical protein
VSEDEARGEGDEPAIDLRINREPVAPVDPLLLKCNGTENAARQFGETLRYQTGPSPSPCRATPGGDPRHLPRAGRSSRLHRRVPRSEQYVHEPEIAPRPFPGRRRIFLLGSRRPIDRSRSTGADTHRPPHSPPDPMNPLAPCTGSRALELSPSPGLRLTGSHPRNRPAPPVKDARRIPRYAGSRATASRLMRGG